ncbi:MAG: YicC/YloC family endoribonuclease [Bryobacterales bacterium]|nr:YicC family protein [Bryobacteraceae bacterium]MDW8355732.1 YicC/YloC family endoribonuclease [Bryobacterales bacterium]
MSVRSMTGFARVRRSSPAGEVVVEIKSLNHRALDLHVHLPPGFETIETRLRELMRRKAARGHFQVRVTLEAGFSERAAAWNRPLLAAWIAAFRQAAQEFGISSEPDLNAALSIPGMFREGPAAEPDEGLADSVLAAVEEAVDCLNAFREREGSQIAEELHRRIAALAELTGRMEAVRAEALPAFHKRLEMRLRDLLGEASLDPQRLAQEAALLVERSDIGEELLRLKLHAEQAAALLEAGGEAGKKLDFLLQEMGRETNTILSKSAGAGEPGLVLTDLALAAKAEIEKMREQTLNLE